MKTFQPKTKIVFQKLFRLERSGRYTDALDELETIWSDRNSLPDVGGLDAIESAEIFLRCGSLIGFHGHNEQIKDAQEQSKDLLTEAHRLFIELGKTEKLAECENYLALAYWRKGEIIEAETWLESALSYNISNSNHTRIYSHLIKSVIYLADGRDNEVAVNLKKLETDFKNCGDAFLTGSFCTNLGLAFKNLSQSSEALKYLELAGFYHRKSGHQIYLGTVENNLAQLYKIEGRFEKAHEAIYRATKIFKKIKDLTREGFALDTKAQIFFVEGKYKEALITIEAAIAIMRKGENLAYLVETYLTKTKILVYLNDISAATFCLFEAVRIAKANISEEAANNLVREFEKTLQEKNSTVKVESPSKKESDENDVELILPPAIAHYQNIQGVRIKNTHLESFGLPKDSLAIIAKVEVKRGDLAALTELEDDSVSCGFYDADFGIVCLENGNGEPQLFDEKTVETLGKIIGVCSSKRKTDGKIFVKPLYFDR